MVLQCEWAQIQAIILNNDGNGFGFGISGSRNSGAVVRNIFPGGAADRDGTLQNGDHLLAVGEVRLWGMGAEQVAAILRQAGQESIRLVVARPIDPTVPNYLVNSAIVPTKSLSDPNELDRTLQSGLFTLSAPTLNGFNFDQLGSDLGESQGFDVQQYHSSDALSSQNYVGSSGNQASSMAQVLSYSNAEDSNGRNGTNGGLPMLHNLPLPLTSSSGMSCGGSTSVVQTMVTHSVASGNPQVTVVSPTESFHVPIPEDDPSSPSSSSTMCAEAVIHQGPSEGGSVLQDHYPTLAQSQMFKSNSQSSLSKLKNINHHVQTSDSIEGNFPTVIDPQDKDGPNKENLLTKTLPGPATTPNSVRSTKHHRHHHHHHHHHHPKDNASKPKSLRQKKANSLKRSGSHDTSKEEVGPSLTPNAGGARKKVVRKTSMPTNGSDRALDMSLTDSVTSLASRQESLVVLESSHCEPGSSNEVVMVLPEKEEFKITLVKDGKGLGITVAGYICEKEDLCGIFVKSVIDGSMADKSGCITVNDQIIEVDGISLSGYSNQEAVEILKNTGDTVKMTIVRYLRGLKFEELKLGISQANVATPTAPLSQYQPASDLSPVQSNGSTKPPVHPSSKSNKPYRGVVACNSAHDPLGYTSSNASSNNANVITSSSSSISTSISTKRRKSTCTMSQLTCDELAPRGNSSATSEIKSPLTADYRSQLPRHSVPNILDNGSILSSHLPNATSVPSINPLNLPNGQLSIFPGDWNNGSIPPEINPESQESFSKSSRVTHHDSEEERLKAKWGPIMEENYVIVVAQLQKPESNSGLGISLEGTVDVENGKEVRPHHYIRSILPNGPVDKDGKLTSGDELLEVNGKCLKGLFHEEVVASLKNLPVKVTLVCGRKCNGPSPIRGTIVDNVDPSHSEKAFESRKILSGSLQSLLAAKSPEFLVKAKSEVSLACTTSHSISVELNAGGFGGAEASCSLKTSERTTSSLSRPVTTTPNNPSTGSSTFPASGFLHRGKSKSLETMQCGAMWSSFVEEVILNKGHKGLGFSILDYQDPQNMTETVIVVRSLVPGGVAQHDKRILPGDRLVYVNDTRLENASLDAAVHALKGASFGPVRLGIARPLEEVQRTSPPILSPSLPEVDQVPQSITKQDIESSRYPSSSTNAEGTTQASNISDLKTDDWTNSDNSCGSSSGSSTIDDGLRTPTMIANGMMAASDLSMKRLHSLEPAKNIPILPKLPKYSIVVNKSSKQFLGVHLEALAFELSGTIVRQIDPNGALAKDGRLRVGDLVLFLNHESMWRVTSSQAKIILRRAEFVSAGIPIIFIPEEHLGAIDDATTSSSHTEDIEPVHSLSESLKVSSEVVVPQKHSPSSSIDDLSLDESSVGEIIPDLTVESGIVVSTLYPPKFPSDLIESSVDPEPINLELEDDVFVGTDSIEPPVIDTTHIDVPLTSVPCDILPVPHGFGGPDPDLDPSDSGEALNMVRVYNPPPVSNSSVRPQPPSNFNSGFQNGSRISPNPSPMGTAASPGFLKQNLVGNKIWGESRTVDVFRQRGAGLGVSIVGGKVDPDGPNQNNAHVSGIFIKSVLPESPAGRTGQLFTGDRILEINGVPLDTSDHTVAVNAIRSAGDPVRFVVQSLKSPSMEATSILPDQRNANLNIWESQQQTTPSQQRQLDQPSSPTIEAPPQEESPKQFQHTNPPPSENSLAPNAVDRRGSDASSVSSISDCPTPPKSPELIQAGLTDLERQAIQQKLQAELQAKKEQHLTVYTKSSIDRGDEDKFSNEMATHVEIPVNTEDRPARLTAKKLKSQESSSGEDEDDNEEDYNEEKINMSENFKVLSGDVIEAKIKRDTKMGMGMALSGHKDRMRMGTFICGLHPNGPAASMSKFKPGDELLKVHNTVVRGRCHLNVSAIIKKLPDDIPINVVVLRSEKNQEKIAVPEITQFPIFLDDVIFGSPEFGAYLSRREIKMKKTTEGLGLMIIEGSHKVLGKGIFISDIQQNSLAFKANMKVGDMILATNTESFLGISYDDAAMILKQVTGTVRILVVNPTDEISKREEAKNAPSKSDEKPPTAEPTKQDPTKVDVKETKAKTPATLAPEPSTAAKTPTKSPAKSPGKSPGKTDPNKIEIKKDSNGLGLSILGGSDSFIGGIFVHEIYGSGAVEKDGRLQVGDRLVSVNGVDFKSIKYEDALRVIRGSKDKVTFVIDRKEADPESLFTDVSVELVKKPGKGLGMSVVGSKEGHGVFISDVISGSVAELNGQICQGDQILSVNDKDLKQAEQDEAVAALKTASGTINLKLRRIKPDGYST